MGEKTGVRDIAIGFVQVREGLDYGRVLSPRGIGRNRPIPHPSLEYLTQHGIPAQDQCADHVVPIYPTKNQAVELREFFHQRGLHLSNRVDSIRYTMFGRYEYQTVQPNPALIGYGGLTQIHCRSVIVCLSAAHRSTAIQLVMRFGRHSRSA